jgi:hypothetical protein
MHNQQDYSAPIPLELSILFLVLARTRCSLALSSTLMDHLCPRAPSSPQCTFCIEFMITVTFTICPKYFYQLCVSYIGMAAFRDVQCPRSLMSAFKRASRPECLTVTFYRLHLFPLIVVFLFPCRVVTFFKSSVFAHSFLFICLFIYLFIYLFILIK